MSKGDDKIRGLAQQLLDENNSSATKKRLSEVIDANAAAILAVLAKREKAEADTTSPPLGKTRVASEFMLVSEADAQSFEKLVNAALADGWRMSSGLVAGPNGLAQGFVKYAVVDDVGG